MIGLTLISRFFFFQAEDGIRDRKSTRLNSSHTVISYAVFCLKKKRDTIMRNLIGSSRNIGKISKIAFLQHRSNYMGIQGTILSMSPLMMVAIDGSK